ncbi:sigma 54-interacting transcriptional regulator [Treponema sp. R6D11]
MNPNDGYKPLIAKSPAIQEQIEIIKKAAKTDSSVLLLGESGVGKEVFAEQIYVNSLRNSSPFVKVNCAAIPEGLLESELFGHVKGAFTSAVSNRQGRFEMANGGGGVFGGKGGVARSPQGEIFWGFLEKKIVKKGGGFLGFGGGGVFTGGKKGIDEPGLKRKYRRRRP